MTAEQGTSIGIGSCLLDYFSLWFKKITFSQYGKMTRKWKIMEKTVGLG